MTPHALSAACVLAAAVALAGGIRPAQQPPSQAAAPAAPRIPAIFVPPEPLDDSDRGAWTSLFDGTTLSGWDGNPEVWRVEGGAISAVSTAARRIGSTHLIWQGGEVADFELQVDVRLEGDIHSGIAYRSAVELTRGRGAQPATAAAGRGRGPAMAVPVDARWTLYGPGFDYDYDYDRLMAGNVEDRGSDRREVAWRGGIVRTEAGKRPRLIGTLGDADALMEVFKVDQWNRIHVVARGHQLTHIVNGPVVTILVDEDPAYFRSAGLIGLQIEQYGLGRVSFRNIWLRK